MPAWIDHTREKRQFEFMNGSKPYEGFSQLDTVWSAGFTPEDAVRAFCVARLGSHKFNGELRPLEGGDPKYSWGCRFTCDGTHFKAAGIHIPGACLLTWWA